MSHEQTILSDAVCETFANLAFLDLMPGDASIGKRDASCVAIDVFEPVACRVAIAVPPALLDEIATSATGGECAGDDLEIAKRDLLLEVANVIAGAFASRVREAGAPVELGLPRVEAPDANLSWRRFETEEGWVDVSLEFESAD
ncbi:MAG: chemotaxis protein CheX [Myxococcales bacterium]|nr:chemotaxis protein CheX [Myxococcales bacterium]